MAHFYVEKEGKWNIFSTVIDDFIYDEFLTFDDLKMVVIWNEVKERLRELKTLGTSHPELNTMTYQEAIEIIRDRNSSEQEEEDEL